MPLCDHVSYYILHPCLQASTLKVPQPPPPQGSHPCKILVWFVFGVSVHGFVRTATSSINVVCESHPPSQQRDSQISLEHIFTIVVHCYFLQPHISRPVPGAGQSIYRSSGALIVIAVLCRPQIKPLINIFTFFFIINVGAFITFLQKAVYGFLKFDTSIGCDCFWRGSHNLKILNSLVKTT